MVEDVIQRLKTISSKVYVDPVISVRQFVSHSGCPDLIRPVIEVPLTQLLHPLTNHFIYLTTLKNTSLQGIVAPFKSFPSTIGERHLPRGG